MKILAIGRNYVKHIEELNNKREDEPVVFHKPDTAILRESNPFYYPSFSKDIHYEVEIVIKICNICKNVSEKFAHRYYNEIGIGIDLTARDIQTQCKTKGLPWEKAKAFDHSAPIGKFIHKDEVKNINNLDFSLKKNGEFAQIGNTKNMIFNIDYLVSYLSKFYTLKKGDLIYTGTPEGVGPIAIGDCFEAYIEDKKLLHCDIK